MEIATLAMRQTVHYNLYAYLYELAPALTYSSMDINIEEILPIMYLFQCEMM